MRNRFGVVCMVVSAFGCTLAFVAIELASAGPDAWCRVALGPVAVGVMGMSLVLMMYGRAYCDVVEANLALRGAVARLQAADRPAPEQETDDVKITEEFTLGENGVVVTLAESDDKKQWLVTVADVDDDTAPPTITDVPIADWDALVAWVNASGRMIAAARQQKAAAQANTS